MCPDVGAQQRPGPVLTSVGEGGLVVGIVLQASDELIYRLGLTIYSGSRG